MFSPFHYFSGFTFGLPSRFTLSLDILLIFSLVIFRKSLARSTPRTHIVHQESLSGKRKKVQSHELKFMSRVFRALRSLSVLTVQLETILRRIITAF